ncbi:precorrin-2 C(20)-methyltransferase [Pseudobacteriovorax antillogorgiicola]|uniref:Precorrin-2 C20-methyltransferase /cobalt-factor II C20-methyltransferase n=1 Tax=Pseudobacteriovorax antillogorgiicola TaxID=1513793 RepID=A0A1Y6C6S9_9BACT|nr:precorrin-2 C(20)-methyltransferase [Pseudobacteriovorax antillogorgiicola]TCS50676.1 precorrin-2 C20-methyltransferase /cobalt-factor II C20-methyltransferase [Pseudobacteriovorax antillogorgiicola]SMF40070.1 precorrin-2 C20-methyltransferase /cobalt-factor II C20-methyltransferase [Pseudobacteriovorax antillogorgiicola]
MQMQKGKLYGVGVGPGAPDLLTLRALKVLQSVDVLAIPRPNPWSKSLAWRIAEPNLEDRGDQEKLFLTFPMTKDPDVLVPAWQTAFDEIGERLDQGKNVAFLTQGDCMVYSTFIYLYDHARENWPEVTIEVVPAVSSISAVPSAIGTPLVDGQERVAVLPATYGTEDLKKVLQDFDSVVLMKVGSVMDKVINVLEDEQLLEKAVYVERATSNQERIVRDLRSLKNDKCVYFSMVVVNKKERAGILQGRVH